jgi:tRNA(Ile)-lysidine synthase
MVLAARWSQFAEDAPVLSVATVDHALRLGSSAEAAEVARQAGELGLNHVCLVWEGAKPKSGIQTAARDARYRLLSSWCECNQAEAIVTAHTLDDQAETFIMRLARGSGLDGLAGMAAEMVTPWPVVRPLLTVRRQELRGFLSAEGNGWIDDSSNEDTGFERIRVRQALVELEKLGLTPASIALSAQRLRRSRQALEQVTADLAKSAVSRHCAGYGELDRQSFDAAPDDVRLRLLQQLVWRYGGHQMPRLAALERMLAWLDEHAGHARVLAGCRIVRRKSVILFGREPARIDPTPLVVDRAEALMWDQRFKVQVHSDADCGGFSVVPFGAVRGERARPWREARPELPAFVCDSLPAVLQGGRLFSVPQLGYMAATAAPEVRIDVSFIGHACNGDL